MKRLTLTFGAFLLLSNTGFANVFDEINEAPVEGAVNRIAKRAVLDSDHIRSEYDAKRAIRIMLEMVTPPEYKGQKFLSSEEDKIKVRKRINGNEKLRYELVKKISDLALRFRISNEELVDSLERVMKHDGDSRIRRLSMISLLSILEDDQSKRSEILDHVANKDAELIFVGYSDANGIVSTSSKFKRGLAKDTLKPLYRYTPYKIDEVKIELSPIKGDQKLSVDFIDRDYLQEDLDLTKEQKLKRLNTQVERLESVVEVLKNDPEYAQKYVESDLALLANAEEDRWGRDMLWVKTSQRSARGLKQQEVENLIIKIKRDGLPHLTIDRLNNEISKVERRIKERETQLANGVTIALRNNSVLWAKNLLERNERGEEFNFNVLYQNAVKKSCSDKTKFECQDDLLK